MRTIQGPRGGWLVGVLAVGLLTASAARADVATERPGSILIFPKVVRDGTRDTIIQITNTGNLVNHVRCYYLDGQRGRNGQPLCSETDFELTLTRQQPTHWNVETGRQVSSLDPFGTDGSGLDPGLIPPVSPGFTGALICVEVGDDGLPAGQNKLKGEATLFSFADESKYNAIAVAAGANVSKDNVLDLNNTEYNACPAMTRFSFNSDGAPDPVIEDIGNPGSRVDTVLSLLPCKLDLQNGIPTPVTVNFDVYSEFEEHLTGGTTFSCWTSFDIGTLAQLRSSADPSNPNGALTTPYATVKLTSTPPVVGIAESFYTDGRGNTAAAAVNLYTEGAGVSTQIRLSDQ